jgi:hypothetical protein
LVVVLAVFIFGGGSVVSGLFSSLPIAYMAINTYANTFFWACGSSILVFGAGYSAYAYVV